MLVTIGNLAKELGVHTCTVRRWDVEGKITSTRTNGKHRRYDLDAVISQLDESKKDSKKITIIYSRVSTQSRKGDLQRQSEMLEQFCCSNGWKYKVIEDIGSGINYKKKGLTELIKLVMTNKTDRIVINYKDRLVRFGYELIESICKLKGVEIVTVSQTESKSFEQEMTEDILAILTVFSARLYGSRSHKNKKIVAEVKAIEDLINEKND